MLILRPQLLLIDEPSGGLAPIYIDRVFDAIQEISRTQQIPTVIVEQKLRHAFSIADTVYVMRNGRIAFRGSPGEARDAMHEAYFGFEDTPASDS